MHFKTYHAELFSENVQFSFVCKNMQMSLTLLLKHIDSFKSNVGDHRAGWSGWGCGDGSVEFAPKFVIRCKKHQFWRFFVLYLDPEDPGMLVKVSSCSLHVQWTPVNKLTQQLLGGSESDLGSAVYRRSFGPRIRNFTIFFDFFYLNWTWNQK